MKYLGETNPTQMRINDNEGLYNKLDPMKRFAIRSQVAATADRLVAQAQANIDKVSQELLHQYTGLANTGSLPPDVLEKIRRDQDPFVRAEKYEHLKHLNDTAGGDKADKTDVQAIMDEYALRGQRTVPSITKAREELRYLRDNGPAFNGDLMSRALRELQIDLDSVEGRGRAEQNTQLHALEVGFKSAEEVYKAQKNAIEPFLKKFVPDTERQDLAQMRERIRREGADKWKDVVRDKIDELKTKANSASDMDKLFDKGMPRR